MAQLTKNIVCSTKSAVQHSNAAHHKYSNLKNENDLQN